MSLRFKWKFSILVILLELLFVGLFLFYVRYDLETATPKDIQHPSDPHHSFHPYPDLKNDTNRSSHYYLNHLAHHDHHEQLDAMLEDKPEIHVEHYYSVFQDIHIIVFIGFGFLMTFLKRYGFSSVGFTFLLGAFAIQWQTLVHAWIDHFDDPHHEKTIRVNIETMIKADFAAAAILVSFGVVLGKTSPIQLIVMVLFEIVCYEGNQKIVFNMLGATDVGDSMVVHAFGAYFGLAVAAILYKKDIHGAEEKEGSVYQSDIFSMIGTVFLWICWPSFNAATAVAEGRVRAVINTYFSLTGSVIMAFAVSSLVNKKGKFQMDHIQNSSLAGGVAIGSIADLVIQPGVAMLVGMVAGAVSVLGFRFLSPLLFRKLNVHDTCGVHNLHGIPGLISAVASIIVVISATPEVYKTNFAYIFGDEVVTGYVLAGRQAACLGISLAFAVVGGIITGLVMKLPIFDSPRGDELFDDDDLWVIPVDESLHIVRKSSGLMSNL